MKRFFLTNGDQFVYTDIMATIQKKVSRGHTYWQIVESRRINGKPRPVVLMHLGTAEALLRRLHEEPTKPLKAKVFQFGALAALWNIAEELEIVPTIARIEETLAQRLIEHFRVDLRTLLFDATNFETFIDTQTKSELAQRGHAKSKRMDLRILGLALLVSTDFHVPLLSHLYPGNQNDASMFGRVTETLVSRYRQFAKDCEHITLVFDGGDTSQDIILKVDQRGYHFITSLTLTHHKDLLQVPLRKFGSFAQPRLKGIRAYRTTKEIWGQGRTVVKIGRASCRERV